jgi:hypothetical protein
MPFSSSVIESEQVCDEFHHRCNDRHSPASGLFHGRDAFPTRPVVRIPPRKSCRPLANAAASHALVPGTLVNPHAAFSLAPPDRSEDDPCQGGRDLFPKRSGGENYAAGILLTTRQCSRFPRTRTRDACKSTCRIHPAPAGPFGKRSLPRRQRRPPRVRTFLDPHPERRAGNAGATMDNSRIATRPATCMIRNENQNQRPATHWLRVHPRSPLR